MAERDLETRVTEFRDMLISMSKQFTTLADLYDESYADVDTAPLRDGARLYTILAEDLSKILRGEELEPFLITVEL